MKIPDTAANQAMYPQQLGQKPGLEFPICRIVGVICLSSCAVLNAAMSSYSGIGSSEQSLLRTLLSTFNAGDLVVGDAFYGTYFLLATLLEQHVDAVFEQLGARKRVTDFRKGQHLGQNDYLIKLTKPVIKPDWMTQEDYNKAPAVIVLRELKVNGKILITTLLSAKTYPKDELKTLYNKRWHSEVDPRKTKIKALSVIDGKA